MSIQLQSGFSLMHKASFTLCMCVCVCICVCVCVKLVATLRLWDVASNSKNGYRTHSLRLIQICKQKRIVWMNLKIGNITIIASFVFSYLQFLSSFPPFDVSKCEIRGRGCKKIIFQSCKLYWQSQFLMAELKQSLAILTFLCCGKFVKNSNSWVNRVSD